MGEVPGGEIRADNGKSEIQRFFAALRMTTLSLLYTGVLLDRDSSLLSG
jgi:hypothetical protein